MMNIHFTLNDEGHPPGKLADVELRFASVSADVREALTALPGGAALVSQLDALSGLKFVGFAIWERPGTTNRTVTFPARQYSVNGERRSFALLRPIEDTHAGDAIRDQILAAYTAESEGAQ